MSQWTWTRREEREGCSECDDQELQHFRIVWRATCGSRESGNYAEGPMVVEGPMAQEFWPSAWLAGESFSGRIYGTRAQPSFARAQAFALTLQVQLNTVKL